MKYTWILKDSQHHEVWDKKRLAQVETVSTEKHIFENLYSPASDSCVRLQQSLEEEDGGRNQTLKSLQRYILQDIFLCLAKNQSERWIKTDWAQS